MDKAKEYGEVKPKLFIPGTEVGLRLHQSPVCVRACVQVYLVYRFSCPTLFYFSLQLLGHVDTESNVSEHDNESDTDHQDDDSDNEDDTDTEASNSDNNDKEDDTDNEASDTDDDSGKEGDSDSDIVTEEDGAKMKLTDDGTGGRHPTTDTAKTDNTADMNDEASSCTLSQPSEGSHQTGHGKKSHMLVHNDFKWIEKGQCEAPTGFIRPFFSRVHFSRM